MNCNIKLIAINTVVNDKIMELKWEYNDEKSTFGIK